MLKYGYCGLYEGAKIMPFDKKQSETKMSAEEQKQRQAAMKKDIAVRKKELASAKQTSTSKGKMLKNLFSFDAPIRQKPKTTIKSIPYKRMHPQGIMELLNGKFSKTYKVADINYISAKDDDREEVFAGFVAWLNSLSPHILVQITVINRAMDRQALYDAVLIDKDRPRIIDTITGIDLTEEYNTILSGFLDKSTHNCRRDKYFTVTVADFDVDSAHRHFNDIEGQMRQKFKSMAPECRIDALDSNDKIQLLASIYRGSDIPMYTFNDFELENAVEKGYIAPDGMSFQSSHVIIDEKRYAKSIFVRDLPSELTDEFIHSILDTQVEMNLTINIKPIDTTKAKSKIRAKVVGYQEMLINRQRKKIQRHDFSDVEMDLPPAVRDGRAALDETEEAVNKKKQKLFSFNLVMVIWGNSLEDIAFKEERIRAKAEEMVVDLGEMHFQQELAFQSALPIGFNNISIKRTIPSEAMGLFTPFDRLPTVQDGGFFYSLHAETKQPIVINNNELKSPSGFVLGSSGSGKGMFIKPIIAYILMATDDDVILIDPENENGRMVGALGGQAIELSSLSRDNINPFDVPLDDEDFAERGVTANELKLDLILSIISTMTNHIDKEIIRSIVDNILKTIYIPFQKSKDPVDTPTFKDFYNQLEGRTGEIEEWLCNVLYIFANGSWDMFSRPTNVKTDNRFICYNTSRLGDELKAVSSFIMFDAIWNRIAKNRNTGRKTWIFVDEAHLVFSNPDEIKRVEAMYRRIRKYDGRIISITQNTADLLRWEAAQTMLQNSDFIAILNQKKMDRDMIQKILGIPDAIMPSITNSGKGEGLIFAQNMLIPFANLFPNKTRWYELMTTNSEELALILAKEAKIKELNAKKVDFEKYSEIETIDTHLQQVSKTH